MTLSIVLEEPRSPHTALWDGIACLAGKPPSALCYNPAGAYQRMHGGPYVESSPAPYSTAAE